MDVIYKNTDEEKRLAKRIFINELAECEKFPKYIMIEPVDICNARCIMCNAGKHMKKDGGNVMTMDLFENIVMQIQPYVEWIEMVTLVGRGESLLDKTLELKVKKLREIGIKRIQLSTNAALLNAGRTTGLFENGLNDLRVSIDSIRKDAFEKIRRGLVFEKVIENTEKAIQIRNERFPDVPIRIRAVELPENRDERDEWLKFWNQRLSGIDVAQFMPYSAKEAGEVDDITAVYPCISVFSTLVIRSLGQVNLCCADLLGEVELGNFKEASIAEIWQGEKFRSIRKMHLKGKRNKIALCQGCELWGETK